MTHYDGLETNREHDNTRSAKVEGDEDHEDGFVRGMSPWIYPRLSDCESKTLMQKYNDE